MDYNDLDYTVFWGMRYLLMAIDIVANYLNVDVAWITPFQLKIDALVFEQINDSEND